MSLVNRIRRWLGRPNGESLLREAERSEWDNQTVLLFKRMLSAEECEAIRCAWILRGHVMNPRIREKCR